MLGPHHHHGYHVFFFPSLQLRYLKSHIKTVANLMRNDIPVNAFIVLKYSWWEASFTQGKCICTVHVLCTFPPQQILTSQIFWQTLQSLGRKSNVWNLALFVFNFKVVFNELKLLHNNILHAFRKFSPLTLLIIHTSWWNWTYTNTVQFGSINKAALYCKLQHS